MCRILFWLFPFFPVVDSTFARLCRNTLCSGRQRRRCLCRRFAGAEYFKGRSGTGGLGNRYGGNLVAQCADRFSQLGGGSGRDDEWILTLGAAPAAAGIVVRRLNLGPAGWTEKSNHNELFRRNPEGVRY